MRDVPASLLTAWRSGLYIGDRRPMARATIHRPKMRLHRVGGNVFSSFMWREATTPREMRNIKKVEWNRSVDSDAGDCTITLWNVKPLEIGEQPTTADFDHLGYYTPTRGSAQYSSRWGHTVNEWANLLLPDNIIRLYEGYGVDPDVCPSDDPNLVRTGTWKIDTVKFTHEGEITITCRDMASILFDQIAYPPVVPFEAGPKTKSFKRGKYAYPVQFEAVQPEPQVNNVPLKPQRVPLSFDDTSNTPYIATPYGPNSWYRGHRGSEAFDESSATYWLSIGNPRPDQGYSFEWVQGKCKKTTVSEVRFRTRGSGYTAYVSVYADGEWVNQGGVVPYDQNHPFSAPNGSDIPYVSSTVVRDEGEHVVTFPKPIKNVTKVRVAFGNLWNSGLDASRPWRAAVRDVRAYGGQLTKRVVTRRDIKNYDDYTDIVKLFLAWGGFFWPNSGATEKDCDGNTTALTFNKADNALPLRGSGGRVWGDFKLTGTYGPATLDVGIWDKKPLIECIRYVADIVGYLFYVDETGGAVFRPPNIYRPGNLMRSLSRASGTWTPTTIRIDEAQVLESLEVELDGANLRERVFIANADGSAGHMAQGWNPNPVGLRRVGGWTDQNFETEAECRVMAEMITLRQLFSYRTDTLVIPGNPQIQVDDQVRVFERVTSEGFLHYVRSIGSTNDLESGEWTYSLGTHWLGERPFKRWAFDPRKLSRETRRYLEYIYRTSEGSY